MPLRHCTCAVLLAFALVAPLPAAPQQAPAAAGGSASTFIVFVQGRPIGSEQVAVVEDAGGWTITSSGRLIAPLDVVTRRLVIHHDRNWKPLELTLDSTVRGQAQTLHTTISGDTATSEIGVAGQQSRVLTSMSPAEVLLPNLQFGAFEALSARLVTAVPGSTILALAPPAEVGLSIRVGESSIERTQTPLQTIDTRRTHITVAGAAPGAPDVEMDVWADQRGRLLRISVPAQALEVVRDDLASPASRQVPISRPNDEQVRIPSNGFILVGTLSKPTVPSTAPLSAIVLVGGSGPTDRDELVSGIPIFGQLADALADAGFLVLRYDKRGVGQSGGRPEAATIADYAEDARAAVKFLASRKDVDPDRIALLGHGEGGSVAMIAATREKRIIALVLVATIGVTGAELNLEQVKRALDRSTRSEAEKQTTLDLQRKIQQAVLTGSGWDQIAAYRKQADTPWFQSLLAFDPAKVMRDVRQPILIVHGDLDTQIPPANADRLKSFADERKNRPAATVVKVPGVNHLLVPATTGEVEEYSTLKDKKVSPDVSQPIATWLRATLVK